MKSEQCLNIEIQNLKPSRNGYKQKHEQLLQAYNGEIKLVDCKGEWIISGLSPKDMGWCGSRKIQRYDLHIKLENEENPKLKWSHYVYVVIWENDDITHIKQRLKSYIGYMPQPKTMKSIFNLIEEMIKGWKEQDLWYATQDKVATYAKIEDLKRLLIERYQHEEMQREEERIRYRRTPTWLLYLTKEEEEDLKEYQRILNERYYLDLTESYGSSHGYIGLETFSKEVTSSLHQIDQERKRVEEDNRKERLAILLDTEPAIRKLVSHYLQAKKEAKNDGVYDVSIQMVNRLYGYSLKETDYYKKYHQLTESYLHPYDLTIWDVSYMGREAILKEEILPPTPSQHERKRRFYYGDRVLIDGKGKKVKKVGVKYLYVETERNPILLNNAVPYITVSNQKIG